MTPLKHYTIALAALAMLALSGCSTGAKALRVTQQIEGSGSFTLGNVSVIVENARQEDGRYKADKLDMTGLGIEIHATNYSRPLIPAKQ